LIDRKQTRAIWTFDSQEHRRDRKSTKVDRKRKRRIQEPGPPPPHAVGVAHAQGGIPAAPRRAKQSERSDSPTAASNGRTQSQDICPAPGMQCKAIERARQGQGAYRIATAPGRAHPVRSLPDAPASSSHPCRPYYAGVRRQRAWPPIDGISRKRPAAAQCRAGSGWRNKGGGAGRRSGARGICAPATRHRHAAGAACGCGEADAIGRPFGVEE